MADGEAMNPRIITSVRAHACVRVCLCPEGQGGTLSGVVCVTIIDMLST